MAPIELLGAAGTGAWISRRGSKSLRILGEDVPVRAAVEVVHGLSAHADADGLLCWLRTAERPPRRVFVVHGDPGPAGALHLASRNRTELGVGRHRARVP